MRLRIRVATIAALAAAGLVVGLHAASARVSDACTKPDTSLHWEAVFAHFSSPPQATGLIKRLSAVGFKDIQLERDYCDDWEVIITGVDYPRQRGDFFNEAASAKFAPSFEAPDLNKYTRTGELTAIFGVFPTLDRANARQRAMAANGFRENSDIIRVSARQWKVVIFRIPAKVKVAYTKQALRGGFKITYG